MSYNVRHVHIAAFADEQILSFRAMDSGILGWSMVSCSVKYQRDLGGLIFNGEIRMAVKQYDINLLGVRYQATAPELIIGFVPDAKEETGPSTRIGNAHDSHFTFHSSFFTENGCDGGVAHLACSYCKRPTFGATWHTITPCGAEAFSFWPDLIAQDKKDAIIILEIFSALKYARHKDALFVFLKNVASEAAWTVNHVNRVITFMTVACKSVPMCRPARYRIKNIIFGSYATIRDGNNGICNINAFVRILQSVAKKIVKTNSSVIAMANARSCNNITTGPRDGVSATSSVDIEECPLKCISLHKLHELPTTPAVQQAVIRKWMLLALTSNTTEILENAIVADFEKMTAPYLCTYQFLQRTVLGPCAAAICKRLQAAIISRPSNALTRTELRLIIQGDFNNCKSDRLTCAVTESITWSMLNGGFFLKTHFNVYVPNVTKLTNLLNREIDPIRPIVDKAVHTQYDLMTIDTLEMRFQATMLTLPLSKINCD